MRRSPSTTKDFAEPPGPKTGELVRLGAIALLQMAVGAACYARGWWVAGLVFTALGISVVVVSWLAGRSLARFALAARRRASDAALPDPEMPANVTFLEAVFGAHGMIGSRQKAPVVATQKTDPHEDAIDAQVGSMLRRTSAVEERFSEALLPVQREKVNAARLAERGLTFAWLETAPSWCEAHAVSDDGTNLVGRAMVVDPASLCWVVLVHGYAGRWHEMILYARHWASQGYNLLLVEQRAHGRSGGRWRGMGYLERRDLVAWTQWLTDPDGPAGPGARVVLHGHSMGAASVCLASAEPDLPQQVCAVISDSAFASGWEACAHLLGDGGLPEHPTLELMRASLLAQRGGYDMVRANVSQALRRPGPPVLIIHGAQDSLVPVATGRRLYEEAVRPKALLVVPGAGHCQACLADPVAYYGEIFSFVNRFCEE